jgi:hypothetical protein
LEGGDLTAGAGRPKSRKACSKRHMKWVPAHGSRRGSKKHRVAGSCRRGARRMAGGELPTELSAGRMYRSRMYYSMYGGAEAASPLSAGGKHRVSRKSCSRKGKVFVPKHMSKTRSGKRIVVAKQCRSRPSMAGGAVETAPVVDLQAGASPKSPRACRARNMVVVKKHMSKTKSGKQVTVRTSCRRHPRRA